ncbi:MAG: NUDIX domain-containing protein [Thermaerobacter sp.]|nr:NUDIX domain-containing protein [Thermaerobacter sp.]
MNSPAVGVGAIIRQESGRVLLVQRKFAPEKAKWAFPGGHLHWHEDVRSAIQREVHEECGIEVAVGELLFVAELRGPDYHFVVLDFGADFRGGRLRPGSDAESCRWTAAADIPGIALAAGMAACLADKKVQEYLAW